MLQDVIVIDGVLDFPWASCTERHFVVPVWVEMQYDGVWRAKHVYFGQDILIHELLFSFIVLSSSLFSRLY